MPASPKKREEIRGKILDSATRLFNRRGFTAVSIDDVMGDAGLTRGSFYRYFSSKTDLYFAASADAGKTWGKVYSSGFRGHCPHFLRHSSGVILLSHRLPATALHWSFDEGKTWPFAKTIHPGNAKRKIR